MGGPVVEADHRLGVAHHIGERPATGHHDDRHPRGSDHQEPLPESRGERQAAAELDDGWRSHSMPARAGERSRVISTPTPPGPTSSF